MRDEQDKAITLLKTENEPAIAVASILGIAESALRANGSIGTFKSFAESKGVELDKNSPKFSKDARKACDVEFKAIRAEYYAKARPVAITALTAEGYHVHSLQPKYGKPDANGVREFKGVNIAVRQDTKASALSAKAENVLLRKQLAELQAKMAALPIPTAEALRA